MRIKPTERLLHSLDGAPFVIARLVLLGPKCEPYYRAATAEPERGRRQLLGYWGTLE